MCPKRKEPNSRLVTSPSPPPPAAAAAPDPAKVPGEEGQWTTGLFSCIKDPINCIATLFCPCVCFGRNAGILEKSTIITSPPAAPVPAKGPGEEGQWATGLFSCIKDPKNCVAALFCPCVYFGRNAEILERSTTNKPKTGRRENWYHTTPSGDSNGVTWLPKPSHPHGLTATSFTYEELATATDNFSDANLLGKGGFGYVHKGVMANGRVVAVKQLGSGSRQGEREFRTEIEIIGRVHHRNLVSLVGYCTTETRRLLVYEFVPNRDLQFHLHGKRTLVMDWPTRLRVALGGAKGLAYLHEYCRPMIIHRDIKASNILLDDQFEAKVADFGLAKYSLDTETHVSTQVKGTFGYLAPEYASTGQLTNKSDVYSFGVVLLELITGIPPVTTRTSSALGYHHVSLADRCQPLIRRAVEGGSYDDLVDPKLQKEYDPDQMTRMIACAAACVRHSARLRPQISQIVRALEGNMSLDELNVGTVPGHSQNQEGLEIFEDATLSDSQQSSSSIN